MAAVTTPSRSSATAVETSKPAPRRVSKQGLGLAVGLSVGLGSLAICYIVTARMIFKRRLQRIVRETTSKQVAAHRSQTDGVGSSPGQIGMLVYDIYEMGHRDCVVPQLAGPGDAAELHGNVRA